MIIYKRLFKASIFFVLSVLLLTATVWAKLGLDLSLDLGNSTTTVVPTSPGFSFSDTAGISFKDTGGIVFKDY